MTFDDFWDSHNFCILEAINNKTNSHHILQVVVWKVGQSPNSNRTQCQALIETQHINWIGSILVVYLSDSSNILTRIGLGDVSIPVNNDSNSQVEHSKLGVTNHRKSIVPWVFKWFLGMNILSLFFLPNFVSHPLIDFSKKYLKKLESDDTYCHDDYGQSSKPSDVQ